MTDLVLAECHLPESPVRPGYYHEVTSGTPAAGLVISMSNDGEHKSPRNLTFISYDSACMTCNVTTGCVLKVSAVWYQANQSLGSDFQSDLRLFLGKTCLRFEVLVVSIFVRQDNKFKPFFFPFFVCACPIKINIPLNFF